MSSNNLIATAKATVNASIEKVWDALIDPDAIKNYMFGARVDSDWKKGSPITWKGEWQGKPYEDKGKIIEIIPNKKLEYTHFSPLSGQEDKPENYHTVTVDLSGNGDQTVISLSQDNNATEEARQHSERNWAMMLAGLKTFIEGNTGG